MRVAILADSVWLREELPTMRRLIVGLVTEQVQVVRVLPAEACAAAEGTAMITQTLRYPGSSWRVVRDRQIRGLAATLREIEVDVIHALSGSLERPALALGAALGVPVVVGLWSRREAESVHGAPVGVSVTYTAASPAIAEACQRRVGPGTLVEVVGPAAYCGEGDPPPLLSDPRQGLSLLVIGDGVADGHYQALLEAMVRVRPRMRQALYLFYASGTDQHRVWQAATRMKLMEQISIAPSHPGTRSLLVQADVVIQPQAGGVVRSVLVEAMAAGRPIIAAADPAMTPLLSPERAVLVEKGTAGEWEAILRRIPDDPQRFLEIGQAGRGYVYQHHRVSDYVMRFVELYRKLAPAVLSFQR